MIKMLSGLRNDLRTITGSYIVISNYSGYLPIFVKNLVMYLHYRDIINCSAELKYRMTYFEFNILFEQCFRAEELKIIWRLGRSHTFDSRSFWHYLIFMHTFFSREWCLVLVSHSKLMKT